jgi:hypothetical protein
MSNLLLVLDAEGVSFPPQNDDRDAPDFALGWDDFIDARQRFLDQLSGLPGPSERTAPLDPRG